jgi:hypothetical protein
MITLYNETKASWGIENVNGSVIRLAKTKEKRNAEGPSKKRTISIITYTPLFEKLEELKTQLLKSKMTQSPVVLTGKSTAVIFNNKEFKPFVTERNYNLKNILLGSLFLEGKKIINVRNDHTFLLEFFMLGAEFSFIASFNSDAALLSIDLLDQKTNMITQYKFTQENGQIIVKTTDRAATEKEKGSNFRVRVFRPSRPTNVILVHPKDKAELESTIDTSKHQIVEYTDLEKEMETLVTQNFKAVTLFAKSKFREETDIEKKRYDRVVKKLSTRFQTVFKLHLEGKVDKVKY